jgi:2-polyprenyl-3-methyl-5-hydroxy-6-metoxy-1,4-benzoquinol methylase
MPNNRHIHDILNKMTALFNELKTALVEQPSVSNTETKDLSPSLLPPASSEEDLGTFDMLVKAINSNKWPEAVSPNLICDPDTEIDKMDRGRGIVELMIEEELKDLKVLDYGCGEGHFAYIAAEYKPALVVGYDIKENKGWDKFCVERSNLLLTSNFERVKEYESYDVIMLFDVIDHLVGENPVAVLTKLKSLLSEKGKMYVRMHPFCSRHGTHLYHSLNKAYLHLVFTPEELEQLVPKPKHAEPSIRVLYPIKNYNEMISEAGLRIESRKDITEKVDPFFKIPKIAERIMKNYPSNQLPEFQMGLQFIDFVLTK